MNQHLGATYTLSVLVVVAFAIAFHRIDERAGPPKPTERVSARETQAPPAPDPPFQVASPVARAEVVRPKVTAVEPAPPRTPRPVIRPVSKVAARPRGAFARVEPGEALADVARRVYGLPTMAEPLWRANRDQLPSITTPLDAGMTLRTP
jgi:hypothetical protein